ncbi:adenosylmethionine--8-amino-7-oxononanoate transaminase [Ureibacillus thermosphaericus]|uniref:adenosylmethionine--8-amino-7-oxononanoate transaminase n=1 Tax=Ureibacillus thermosphaericus TaxID=51173 RepID=UPI0030C96DE2
MNYSELQDLDFKYIWHPCSQMKDYETFPPIVIERGEGIWLYDKQGNRYLDAVSSWWVNLFGHANPRISKAIADQAKKLEHVIFANFTHEPAIHVATKLVEKTPDGLEKVFFADNGSAAIEIALKMSFQYRAQTGQPKKQRFLTFTNAYHGETLGALSVGAVDLYNKVFQPLLLNVVQAEGPNCYRCPFAEHPGTCDAPCAMFVEEQFKMHADTLSAAIIEPLIQIAGGMNMYPPVFLKKLRTLCDQYDVHLIADEIAVGFGRTGTLFACEQADITPDFLCLSKGITGGYLPLSAVLTTNKIYYAFYDDYGTMKAFLHSHSYSGNPLALRAAQEVLAIFEEEQVLEKIAKKAKLLNKLAHEAFDSLPYVGEYRQTGFVGAIELVADKKTKTPLPSEERIGYRIYKRALNRGILLRPLGNILYFMPPYIISEEEIEWMVNTAKEEIVEFFKKKKVGII